MADLDGIPDVDIGPTTWMVVPAVAFICATATVSLRIYVRRVMLKALGLDDWLLLGAWLTLSAHCFLFMVYGGIVKYQGGLKANFNFAFITLDFQALAYGVTQVLLKAALAAFFLRVLTIEGWQRVTIWVVLIAYCVFTTVFTFMLLFQCGNPLYLGDNVTCLNLTMLNDLTYASAAINAGSDWALTVVPMIVIARSMMTAETKVPIFCIFGLGIVGSIISVLRIPYILSGVIIGTLDGFRNCTGFQMLSVWENCAGIMALSLAALRPLIRKVFNLETVNSSKKTDEKLSFIAPIQDKPELVVSTMRVDQGSVV